MQDDPNRKDEREHSRFAADLTMDGTGSVGDSIRRAFLVHMTEQQRQFTGTTLAVKRHPPAEPGRR